MYLIRNWSDIQHGISVERLGKISNTWRKKYETSRDFVSSTFPPQKTTF